MRVEIKNLLPGEGVNVRRTDPRSGVPALAESLLAQGQLQALLVDEAAGNKYKVVDGNRRLSAFHLLCERGDWSEDREVEVMIRDPEQTTGVEASLAANIMRTALHPVDEFEAFAELAAGGMVDEEIARRFGLSVRVVRQRMALGALHPEIRGAWRSGGIDEDCAAAFTLADSQKRQLDVFKRLLKEGRMWPDTIGTALGWDHDASDAINIVGVDAYRARGGQVTPDLFNDGKYAVSDPALASTMLHETIEAKCKQLVDEEGWAFAYPTSEIKDAWRWRVDEPPKPKYTPEEAEELKTCRAAFNAWQQDIDSIMDETPPEMAEYEKRIADIEHAGKMRAWTPKKRQQAGCLVGASGGSLDIDYGVRKPQSGAQTASRRAAAQDAGAAGDASPAPAQPAEARLSKAVILGLSERVTTAVARTLAADGKTALMALAATMLSRACYGNPPLKISLGSGTSAADMLPAMIEEHFGDRDVNCLDFAEALELLRSRPNHDVLSIMLRIAASTLDLRKADGWKGTDASERAIVGMLDAEIYGQMALEVFSPAEYFAAVPASFCHAALEEMGVDRREWPSKKAELANLATVQAEKRKWLPPTMRYETLTQAALPLDAEPLAA